MSRYPLGQPVRLSGTVRQLNVDGTTTLVNATTAIFVVKITNADGTKTITGTYSSPVNDNTGLYHQDVPATDLTLIDHYQWTFTTTGPGAGVQVGDFDVYDPDEIAVLPLQDGKDQLNIPQSNTSSDAEIGSYIATIETSLEGFTGGPIVNRTITAERAELMSNQTVICVRQRPLVSVMSVTGAGGSPIDISGGLDIDANAGTFRRKLGLPFYGPFFQWLPQVNVTYVAGWGTSVPAAFNTFARIVLQHLWTSQRGASSQPLQGEVLVTPPGFGFAIPSMAAELLNGTINGMPLRLEAYV